SREGKQIVPVRGKQDREPHGPLPGCAARLRRKSITPGNSSTGALRRLCLIRLRNRSKAHGPRRSQDRVQIGHLDGLYTAEPRSLSNSYARRTICSEQAGFCGPEGWSLVMVPRVVVRERKFMSKKELRIAALLGALVLASAAINAFIIVASGR